MVSTWSCWIKSSGHGENNGQKESFSLPNPYSLCHICISTKQPYTCRGNGILYGESVYKVSFCTWRLHKILHKFYFCLRVKDFEWNRGSEDYQDDDPSLSLSLFRCVPRITFLFWILDWNLVWGNIWYICWFKRYILSILYSIPLRFIVPEWFRSWWKYF